MTPLGGSALHGGIAAAVAGAVLLTAGCVRYTRAEAPYSGRFDPLYRRDLSAFEHRIAIENHLGTDGAWTRVAEAWLALANCRPVPAESAPAADRAPAAAFVHATIVLEDVRRRYRAAARATGRSVPSGDVVHSRLRNSDFFDRDPAQIAPGVVEWPAREERWADELPAPVEVESSCARLGDRVLERARPDDEDAEAGDDGGDERATNRPRTIHGWRIELVEAVDRVVDRYGELPESSQAGSLAAAERRARIYGAESAFRLAHVYSQLPEAQSELLERWPELHPDRLWARAEYHAGAIANQSSAPGIDEQKQAHAHLLVAFARDRADAPGKALAHLERALAIGVADRNRWASRYLRIRLLTHEGRWAEAAEMADQLPPRTSRYFAPYAYRAAFAVRQRDQDDRFLGIAKQAFRDRAPDAGPFERALYTDVLRTLASYTFEERTVELLEELGPRSEIYSRVEQLARVALDRGRPENASAAARWLLAQRHDARHDPRYRGILAMAAFLRDDDEAFRDQVERIARRPEALLEAVPTRRRATFFAHADAELARILRQLLPMMAEWGDTAAGRKRRKKWLEIVIDETQEFLRNTDSSLARPKLVELYRLASGLLEDHPRGYAERVGSSDPTPLVLGTVRVRKPDLTKHEPVIWASFEAPYMLTLLPRDDRPPTKWRFGWPEEDESDETDQTEETDEQGGDDA